MLARRSPLRTSMHPLLVSLRTLKATPSSLDLNFFFNFVKKKTIYIYIYEKDNVHVY